MASRTLNIEARRQDAQRQLDAARTAAERNRLGQFATPPDFALDVARFLGGLWSNNSDMVAFLDPGVGTGSLYSAVRQCFPPGKIADACGIEIDPGFADAARDLWGRSLRVIAGDFTRTAPDRAYNLVVANPPYVRHHHIAHADKVRLRSLVVDRCGIGVSGLAGLYIYFLLLCDAWMAPGGLAAWIIPSEFMDVNYGVAVKTYLTESVTTLRIHRYRPSDVQFGDALVTSAVVVFRKSKPSSDHTVHVSFGGTITAPESSEYIPIATLRKSRKWTGLCSSMPSTDGDLYTLGNFFSIKRGIVTGANDFFIIGRNEATRMGIPAEFLQPILPGPRHLDNDVIESDPDEFPRIGKQLVVIDCGLPEEAVRRDHPGLWAYLEEGRSHGVHSGYLTSRRTPWYAQEKREAAPFLCTYMGRTGDSGNPFRFFWNRSRAIAANVYLMLYPRGEMEAALSTNPGLYPAVFDHLRSISSHQMILEGRVYGGGLHKMEPKELANLPTGAMDHILGDRP
jgi:hypothetical protein